MCVHSCTCMICENSERNKNRSIYKWYKPSLCVCVRVCVCVCVCVAWACLCVYKDTVGRCVAGKMQVCSACSRAM